MNCKRQYCDTCLRPQSTCYCKLIVTVSVNTQVIIWQHPTEYKHPKGTAQLLHLCLKNSRIVSGEILSAKDLALDIDNCVLLYPDKHEQSIEANPQVGKGEPQQLLVIDATWRKSRKIGFLNPWINTLPRLSINGELGSYKIRKAETSQQLSTFESVAIALKKLENNNANVDYLNQVFVRFIKHCEKRLKHTQE